MNKIKLIFVIAFSFIVISCVQPQINDEPYVVASYTYDPSLTTTYSGSLKFYSDGTYYDETYILNPSIGFENHSHYGTYRGNPTEVDQNIVFHILYKYDRYYGKFLNVDEIQYSMPKLQEGRIRLGYKYFN